jgi:hypothetical protein
MFWARVLLVSDLVYVAEPLNCLRSHGSNVGTRTPEGLAILEKYQVIDFVLRSFSTSQEVQDEAWNRLARRLAAHIVGSRHRVDLGLLWRTYLLGRRADPHFHRRLSRLAARGVRRASRQVLDAGT